MELESTLVFDKDAKKLDKNERKLLQELIDDILQQPEGRKPLEHHANLFSKRTEHRRLIWSFSKSEGKIILLLYKNRDEAYDALRKMGV
jgi:mRNA-degrading endonuclease RelE of RelBE toxin-antitoxin system